MTGFRYVVAVGALAAPAAAQAAGPACGATITSDTKLRADLENCPGDGLVIGADGITLDLGRKTIDGSGAGVGIKLAGRRGVKIKGGTVQEFGVGIALDAADGNRFSGLAVKGSAGRGIDAVNGSDQNTFDGIASTGNRTGIAITASTGNAVRLSALTDNAVTGVLVFGAAKTRVQGNRVTGNAGNGIAFVEGSTGNQALANRVEGAVTSVVIDSSDGNTLALNKISGGGDGVQVAGSRNVVTGNLVDRSVGGCEGCFGHGIAVAAGEGNVIKANVVTRSAGDGINVAAPTMVVTRNLATRNAGLGINAVSGVVDGGGNRASANGNPAQCVIVSCRGEHGHRSDSRGKDRTRRPEARRNGGGHRGRG